MSTDLIADLLHDVADAVEPGDRLDAIRAATASGGRRTRSSTWWTAGGVGLVAASAVTALALSTGGTPQQIGPASPGRSSTSPTTATEEPVPHEGYGSLDLYFVGDTSRGLRLYREARWIASSDIDERLAWAVSAALGRDEDGSPLPPLDPDYRVAWPAGTSGTAVLDRESGEIEVSVSGDPQDDLRSRGDLSADEARLAVEALVRTAQSAVDRPLPVRFRLFGETVDQLLGVPTAGPITARPDTDVLAAVSLAEPSDGSQVREGKPLFVSGSGVGEGGEVALQVEREDGTAVLAGRFTLDEPGNPPSFTVNWVSDQLTPGDYVVIASMPDADGTVDTDTRRITVVD